MILKNNNNKKESSPQPRWPHMLLGLMENDPGDVNPDPWAAPGWSEEVQFETVLSPLSGLDVFLLLKQGEKTKMFVLKREWLDLGSRNRQDVLSARRGSLMIMIFLFPQFTLPYFGNSTLSLCERATPAPFLRCMSGCRHRRVTQACQWGHSIPQLKDWCRMKTWPKLTSQVPSSNLEISAWVSKERYSFIFPLRLESVRGWSC